jgi:hypothetical protein
MMADPPRFSGEHRARFKELLTSGETYALNFHPECLPQGPWVVNSDARGDDGTERLRMRFEAAVSNAARSAGAPARVNLLHWWIWRLAGSKQRLSIEGLIQRSIELCEVFESKSAELPFPSQGSGIEAGLRRDRYNVDLQPRDRIYDHPHDVLADAKDEFDYWRAHIWQGFRKLMESRETPTETRFSEPAPDGLIYDLRRRLPGESRKAFRDRVAKRVKERYDTTQLVLQSVAYDFAVLLANYIIDRGLRANAARRAFGMESAELINEIDAAWREISTRMGLSWRKRDPGLTKVFTTVGADLRTLIESYQSPTEASGPAAHASEWGIAPPNSAAMPPRPPSTRGSDFWRDMECRFRSLSAEYGDGLHASWSPSAWDGEQKHWLFNGAVEAREEKRFEVVAKRAAAELAGVSGPTALPFWLDLLRLESPYSREVGSNQFYNAQGELVTEPWLMVEKLHQTSAEYCLQIETERLLATGRPSVGEDAPTSRDVLLPEDTKEPETKTIKVRSPRRHGFEPAMDRHRQIAEIVGRHFPNWRTSSSWRAHTYLKRICTDLDAEAIDVPDQWRLGTTPALRRSTAHQWVIALDIAKTGKKLVADQVRTSLEAITKAEGKQVFPKSPQSL